jgi:hypothetical protein
VTYEVWLDWDEDKPIETRPVFIGNALSMGQKLMVGTILDQLDQSKDSTELYGNVVNGLATCFIGWRNMSNRSGEALEYSRENLYQVLQLSEGLELIRKSLVANSVQNTEKKRLEPSA